MSGGRLPRSPHSGLSSAAVGLLRRRDLVQPLSDQWPLPRLARQSLLHPLPRQFFGRYTFGLA